MKNDNMTLKEFLKSVPEEILAFMYYMEVITFNDLKATVVFESTAHNFEFAVQIPKATIEFEIYTKYHNKFIPYPAPGVVLIKNTQFMKVKITTQDKTYEYEQH